MKSVISIFTVVLIFLALSIYVHINLPIEKKKVKKASGAMESLQWMTEIRAYPDKDIPQDKFYKAFEYSSSQLTQLNDNLNLDSWISIGPNNIGGRSNSLAIHPIDTSIVFIGSASGGLWKSTTGGIGASAWTLVNTGYPSLAIGSIAIDSANPNVMYIGTGENYGYQYSNYGLDIRVTRGMYGIGILKTTNAGATWSKSLDWSYNNQRGVWDVVINPKNPNVVYAATSEGIYKTINAGNNWSLLLGYKMVMDLMINPVDTNILYASIGNLSSNSPLPSSEIGIFKSTNSGLNWTKLAGGLPSNWTGKATLDMYKGNPNYIYANIANDPPANTYVGYYRSTNGGLNWTVGSTSVPSGNQGWYNQGHIVKSNDPNSILVGTLNVEKSTNGGTSFSTKSSWSAWVTGATPPGQPEGPSNFVHADVHFFAANPKDPNKIYIASDGGLYRTNDFGNTFYSCNGGYVTSQFYASLGNSNTDSVFCLGGLQDNRSAFYQGTTAWYKTFSGDGTCSQVNSQNPTICYTEYHNGDLYKSTNGALNFNASMASLPNEGSETAYCFNAPYVCCVSNPNYLYAGGTSMYISNNAGSSWLGPFGSFGGGKALSIGVSSTGTDTAYVGIMPVGSSIAGVYRTVNGGLNWTDVSGGMVPNRYPTRINVNQYNSKEVYVTFGGFGTTHVIKSTNAGGNWINITNNLPDVPTHSVVVDPVYPQNVYVGNDLGIYVSTNGGTNWYEYKSGMPYALVFDLTIVRVSRKLRATTHGNGIWERKLLANPVAVQNSNSEIPKDYMLYQNYPNPFNPVTTIKFDIPAIKGKTGLVKIDVFDLLGKKISSLINENISSGNYSVNFDASRLATGAYVYRLSVKNEVIATKKMLLIK
ncbi:MAG: T9SS type A sorting domain-containing protein [Ignavibacteria bacterium]|jgi:photosystem II stability/assembly factor-like uncharacterized protein